MVLVLGFVEVLGAGGEEGPLWMVGRLFRALVEGSLVIAVLGGDLVCP